MWSFMDHCWAFKGAARKDSGFVTTRAIRIAHLYGSMQRSGGIERIIDTLVHSCSRRGYSHALFLLRRLPQGNEYQLTSCSVLNGWPSGGMLVHKLPRLSALASRFLLSIRLILWRPDVLHIHRGTFSHLGIALFSRLAGVSVVRTIHRDPGRDPVPTLLRTHRQLLRIVNRWIVLIPEHARVLRSIGVPASDIHIVPNGIDIQRFDVAEASRDRTRSALGLRETD